MYEYFLRKSRRKTISIEIDNDEKIMVKAPFWATKAQINEVVAEKENWIRKKLEEVSHKNSQKNYHNFIEGEVFNCLGEEYVLKFTKDDNYALVTKDNYIILYDYIDYKKEDRARLITQWYKMRASNYIKSRAYHLSEKLKIPFNKVRITSARTRWGSCSSKQNLNFSWRLIIAPKQVVDYVIIHELAHIVELNHSKRFWSIVASILPNYKIYETWLKDHGHTLDILFKKDKG